MAIARRVALPTRVLALSAAALLGGALVTGCSSSSTSTTETSSGSAAATAAASSAAVGLTIADPWVKAQPSNMTGFFGVITNNTDKDVIIQEGSSDVATMVEMHEMAMIDGEMKMRKKEGGFTIPAHGKHELKPGSDHIMLMGLKSPIAAGQSVTITLKTTDGQEVTASGVGKTIAGGNETYAPGSGSPSMTMSSSS
jgi:copper(I)-binding protein